MPAHVLEVVVWTCVAAFVVCVLCGLAIITGVWSHPDPKIKSWLTKGVIMAVVGGVVTYAAAQFSVTMPSAPPQNDANEAAQITVTRSDGTAPARPRDDRQNNDDIARPPRENDDATPVPEGAPLANFDAPPVPASIEAWAKQTLGPRPLMTLTPMPSCVTTLASSESGAVSEADASACRSALEQLHQDVVVAFYNLKRPYDVRLQRVEVELRRNGLRAGELEKFNYVADEMQRLNGKDSEQRKVFRDYERQLLGHLRNCEENSCKP